MRENALREEEAEQLLKLGEANGSAGALLTLGLAVESNYPAAIQVRNFAMRQRLHLLN